MASSFSLQTASNPSRVEHTECVFAHSMFAKLGQVAFRLSEADLTPVLVIPMGDVTAALPLGSLQQEAGIVDDSPDGRMLALVARALDFVSELRLGDPLPVEVLDGAASWEPGPVYQDLARARIAMQLTTLFDEDAGLETRAASAAWASAERRRTLAAARAPGMALRVQAATIEFAARLGLPSAAAATQLLDLAVHEMGFIDALRVRLLGRVSQLHERLHVLIQASSNNPSRLELIKRVRRLAGIGLAKICACFETLNEQTADLIALLQNIEVSRPIIHRHRDWLHCSLRAWESILSAWDSSSALWSDNTLPLLTRTYRFLAPRYMPMQEWLKTGRAPRPDEARRAGMVW